MRILFLGLFGIWTLSLFFPGQVMATGTLAISSQVRGGECCDPGSQEALQIQIGALKRLKLSATFSLRYDALSDAQIIKSLSSDQFEKAAFLEITPTLARDAGVVYRGPVERWYKAGNAYLVGYTPIDRRRLIDAYMTRYKLVYGVYPRSTVAWMIDAPSLEYLSTKYDVSTHQLTREQWGTDSYTLYGGPVNVPYYPSLQWAMIPAQSSQSASPVLIVRQTITDPLRTYGDAQSATTSQPNDYLFGKRNLQYFQQLVDGALSSTFPNGFGILGLETSMGIHFQEEFVRQLEYVDTIKRRDNVRVEKLSALPAIYPPEHTIGNMSAYASLGQDRDRQAIWINAIRYRARLVRDHQSVLLTDLRVYNDTLSDPYAATASATLNAYWTVPFLFDGSRFRTQPTSSVSKSLGSMFFRTQSPARDGSDFAVIENDFAGNATGMVLPSSQQQSVFELSSTQAKISVRYVSEYGPVILEFFPDVFTVNALGIENISSTLVDQSLDSLAKEHSLELISTRSGDLVTFTPSLSNDVSIVSLSQRFPKLFLPENIGGAIDVARSTSTLVNSHAIFGQSPIRIVLRLRDTNGTPTLAIAPPIVIVPDLSVETTYHEPESAQGEYYIDLVAKSVGSSPVQLRLESSTIDLGMVSVVPHCLHDAWKCLQHPRYVSQFVLSKFDEIMRRLRSP